MKMGNKKNVPEVRFKGFVEPWKEKTLDDIVDVKSGRDYKHLSDGNIPVYGTGGYMLSVNEALSYNKDAVGIGRKGTINKPYILHAPFWTVDTLFYAIPKHKYDLNYIYNVFLKIDWLKKDESSGVPSLSKTTINTIEIKITDNDNEQNKIGVFFNNIDNLITENNNKLDKLKNIKKACLENMFPKKGTSVPEIRFKGFAEEWEGKSLGSIGNTFTGLTGKTKEDFGHGDAKFITYMNVFSNPISNILGAEVVEIDNRQNKILYGDILFTTSSETPEEVGMSSVWLGHEDNIYLNSFCFGYRLHKEIFSYFTAYLLRSQSIRKKISFLAQGISRYNISKNRVMEIEIFIPKQAEQKAIGNYFRNLDDLINKTEHQLTKLKNIKKACLEKMFVNTENTI